MAENLFDLAARITADTKDAERALTATQQKVLQLANEFKKTESTASAANKKIASDTSQMMRAIEAESKRMSQQRTSDTSKMMRAIEAESKRLNQAKTSIGSIGDAGGKADKTLADLHARMAGLRSGVADLNAKSAALTKGTSAAGKVAHEAGVGWRKLSEDMRAVGSSAIVANGPLGGVAGRLQGLASEASKLGTLGPAGIVVAGLAAAAAAGIALNTVLFGLAKSSSQYSESMSKAQLSTGLAKEDLGGLKVISEETGDSLHGLISLAAKLQTSISKGITDPSGDAGKALKFLGLATEDFKKASPDQQLQRTARALQEVTNQGDKNRASMILLGRNWAESADGIVDIGRSFDVARQKAADFGFVLTDSDMKAAHDFTVAIADLGLMLEGLGGRIGSKVTPEFLKLINSIGAALGVNAKNWGEWGDEVGRVLAGVIAAEAEWVRQNGANLAQSTRNFIEATKPIVDLMHAIQQIPPTIVWNVLVNIKQVGDWMAGSGQYASGDPRGLWQHLFNPKQPGIPWDQGEFISLGSTVPAAAKVVPSPARFPGGGGGGGGGGGADPATAAKRLAELRLQAVLIELKQEEDANKRSLDRQWQTFDSYSERYNATENRRHKAVVDGLALEMAAAEKVKGAQQKQIAIQEIKNKQAQEESTHTKNSNKALDDRAKLLDQLNDFISQQTREIGYAKAGTDQYEKAIQELAVALGKQGVTAAEIEFKLALARTNAETQRAIDLTKALTRERRAIAERPRFAEDKNFPQSIGIEMDTTDATRRRRVDAVSDDTREKLRALADDITSTLNSAIHKGFKDGVGEGLKEMALAFGRMLEDLAMQWLASEIFRMLQDVFKPSGGGGILSKIIGVVLGGIAGGVGGSIGGGAGSGTTPMDWPGIGQIGGHAMGGFMQPGEWSMVGERGPELIRAGKSGASVIPNHALGAPNVTINVYARDAQSFTSRDTQRQVTRKYQDAMRKVALEG